MERERSGNRKIATMSQWFLIVHRPSHPPKIFTRGCFLGIVGVEIRLDNTICLIISQAFPSELGLFTLYLHFTKVHRPDMFILGFQEIVLLNPQQIVQTDPEKKYIFVGSSY